MRAPDTVRDEEKKDLTEKQGSPTGFAQQSNRIKQSRIMSITKASPHTIYREVGEDFNTEDYDHISENTFQAVRSNPLTTFSIDVDAASYSNVRRFIQSGMLPPPGAVRIEEMINYFDYGYEQPKNDDPFAVQTEVASCPWNPAHRLVLVGLQARKIPVENLPASNLVFLIDVSGSMQDENKLPLVKKALQLLVNQLREKDRVSMVVYAGAAGLVLPPTSGNDKNKIMNAINNLEAGGSTAGGQGVDLAYRIARESLLKDGNNRVILATDGDFNIGPSSDDELIRKIISYREDGIFLSILGFGMGNYKDNKMQKMADNGNGNHYYIDHLQEAQKVLVNEFGGTLFTIAKDLKVQLEFNPSKVSSYRLIGYENRMLKSEDFADDRKDAGELGAGHTVTALYEIIPVGVTDTFTRKIDDLRYQQTDVLGQAQSNELFAVKLRYKEPTGMQSKLLEFQVNDSNQSYEKTSDNFRFAASVASFGMLLRNSPFKQQSSYDNVLQLAKSGIGKDVYGYRKEFINLVLSVERLAKR